MLKQRHVRRRMPPARAWATLVALATVAMMLAASAAARPDATAADPVRVLAAASLTDVFPKIDPTAQYSFAGSDALAGQIRLGAPGDVFASANMALPNQLFAQGLVEKPVVFATNKLVLITPKSNRAEIKTVFDLRRQGIKLIVGSATVPIGSYTRTILRNLALSSVLANVVSQETDVRSILGKVALGEADAGFVYVTDAKTVADRVNVITLPAWAQPPVRYGITVIKSTKNRAGAVAFINKVLSKKGQAQLRLAGFGPVTNGVSSYPTG